MRWREVSLTVSAELAEAVADVLARFAPQGVAMSYERGTGPAGRVVVVAYLPESAADDSEQRIRQALWHLSQIQPVPEPTFRWIEEVDWAQSWKDHFRPLRVGRRLLIVPAWMQIEEPNRTSLFLDPGMAFGTGAHPTTQLCLEAIEQALRPGDLLVDIGCGSGILSVAAVLLGAGQALACDIDPEALAATERCADRNGVRQAVEVIRGSLDEVRSRLRLGGRSADILVANILAPVLEAMLSSGLTEAVRDGGQLILSGVLAEQSPALRTTADLAGLHMLEERSDGDWRALVFQKESAAPAGGRREEVG